MSDDIHVEVRSPHPGEWIRVNSDPAARLDAMLVRNDGEEFLVAEHMVAKVEEVAPGKMTRKVLFMVQNRNGDYFLWPVPSPVARDHLAYRAMKRWICFPTLH